MRKDAIRALNGNRQTTGPWQGLLKIRLKYGGFFSLLSPLSINPLSSYSKQARVPQSISRRSLEDLQRMAQSMQDIKRNSVSRTVSTDPARTGPSRRASEVGRTVLAQSNQPAAPSARRRSSTAIGAHGISVADLAKDHLAMKLEIKRLRQAVNNALQYVWLGHSVNVSDRLWSPAQVSRTFDPPAQDVSGRCIQNGVPRF